MYGADRTIAERSCVRQFFTSTEEPHVRNDPTDPRKRSTTAPDGSAGAPGARCSCSAAPSSWTRSTSRWSASRCRRSAPTSAMSTELAAVGRERLRARLRRLPAARRPRRRPARRRRVFLISLGVFVVASALGGLVDDGSLLIATRFIKGVSAAFTAPAGLSIITTTFAEGPARNKALSIYTATGATGFSLGPRDRRPADRDRLALGVLPARARRARHAARRRSGSCPTRRARRARRAASTSPAR